MLSFGLVRMFGSDVRQSERVRELCERSHASNLLLRRHRTVDLVHATCDLGGGIAGSHPSRIAKAVSGRKTRGSVTRCPELLWPLEAHFDGIGLTYVSTCSYILAMATVGIRELKNRLSEYLRQVRAGDTVLVTDRGEVIAELHQPERSWLSREHPALAAYLKSGKARGSATNSPDLYPELPELVKPRRRRELLDEERGDR